MSLHSSPRNVKEKLLKTEILTLDKATTIVEIFNAGNMWSDQGADSRNHLWHRIYQILP